jgi:hypothetical protein
MTTQLKIMDKSVDMQIQPIIAITINDSYLEKIKAFRSPKFDFTKIQIFPRIFFTYELINIGNGTALNIFVFPTLMFGNEIIYAASRNINYISEKEQTPQINKFMLLDEDYIVVKALKNHKPIILKIDIYYKNIFGAGFHAYFEYKLYASKTEYPQIEQWYNFVNSDHAKYEKDMVRHESLYKKVQEDADSIYQRIKKEIEQLFTDNIPIISSQKSKSFSIELVEFDKEIESAQTEYMDQLSIQNGVICGKIE